MAAKNWHGMQDLPSERSSSRNHRWYLTTRTIPTSNSSEKDNLLDSTSLNTSWKTIQTAQGCHNLCLASFEKVWWRFIKWLVVSTCLNLPATISRDQYHMTMAHWIITVIWNQQPVHGGFPKTSQIRTFSIKSCGFLYPPFSRNPIDILLQNTVPLGQGLVPAKATGLVRYMKKVHSNSIAVWTLPAGSHGALG